jgi:prevent-host-death family protein
MTMPKRSTGKGVRTIQLSDLGHNAAAALKRVRGSERPLLITRNGKPAAVMLSVEAYERAEQERQILRLLARGEREIAGGTAHDLDEVLKEADRLLADG